MRIIFAAEGWHLDYVPIASIAWRKFFPEYKQSLAIVMDRNVSELSYKKKYGQYVDDVFCVPDVDDVCRAALAKMARIYLSTRYGRETVTLHDIDFVPLQRGFYEGRYALYEPETLMLMGMEVYMATDRGRAPVSAMTAPSDLMLDLYKANKAWDEFIDSGRGSGERTPNNKADVLNAPYFSDEIFTRDAIRRMGKAWIARFVRLIQRPYNMQRDTIDRACWNLADWEKMFRGEYYEAHLLKAYQPNIIVNDKEFDSWGWIPGLKPIFDYFGYQDPREELAINEAIKIYGKEKVDKCLSYRKEQK
jgi:hypothetical protein